MRPERISTATMVTAGVSSAEGFGAFVLSKLRYEKGTAAIAEPSTASFQEWVAAVCTIEAEAQH